MQINDIWQMLELDPKILTSGNLVVYTPIDGSVIGSIATDSPWDVAEKFNPLMKHNNDRFESPDNTCRISESGRY